MYKRYQNFVFDLYGTLVDIRTNEENRLVWEKMSLFYGYYGARYGAGEMKAAYECLVAKKEKEMRDAQAKERKGGTQVHYSHEASPEIELEAVFRELFAKKGAEPDGALVLHAGQFFRALSTEYIRLYQGVPQMLGALRNMGKQVYLLSNAQRMFTEYELYLLDIAKYFDGILISSDYGVKKPDARFFACLLDQYHLKPETCLMVGNDGRSDIAGAKAVGMDTYYIHSNISPEETNVKATYVQEEMDMGVFCQRLGITVSCME